MKIFDYFNRRKERKPLVLKDLTKFRLFRVDAYTTGADDETVDVAELYVLAESGDNVNVQIRRLVRWRRASWTTEPVRVDVDENAGTVAAATF